jgi:hypothetical protein
MNDPDPPQYQGVLDEERRRYEYEYECNGEIPIESGKR